MQKIVLATFNSKYIHSSLGLYSLKAYAEQKGFAVDVMEFSLQTPVLNALYDITSKSPAIAGLAVHIWNKKEVFLLAKMLKQVMPELILVLGGPEVSYAVEDTFSQVSADFIVQGEGESAFAQLISALNSGQTGTGIKGIARKETDGSINKEGGAQIIEDISALAFPYDFAADTFKNRIVYYESTRGCPFDCAYCLSGIDKTVRFKPLGKICEELSLFIDNGVKQVKFVDRTYNLDKNHYFPIMKWLAEQNTKTNFHFEIKADNLDKETLSFLASVPKGLFQFEIGVQSTNEKTLLASGRKQDWNKLADSVHYIKEKNNIHLHLDLIAGLPYEGLAEFKKSFNDVYSLKPDMLQIGFLKLLKGSKLQEDAYFHDYIFMPEPPYEVLGNKYISNRELFKLKILEEVFEQTYNSDKFQYMLEYMTRHAASPYDFYEGLSAWCYDKGFLAVGQGPGSVANYLSDFVKERYPEMFAEVLDCLKMDILLYHDSNFRPEYIKWQDTAKGSLAEKFWRDETRAGRYIKGYKFTSWRDINAKYHIDIFENYFLNEKITKNKAVLFEKKAVKWQAIDDKDFF